MTLTVEQSDLPRTNTLHKHHLLTQNGALSESPRDHYKLADRTTTATRKRGADVLHPTRWIGGKSSAPHSIFVCASPQNARCDELVLFQ